MKYYTIQRQDGELVTICGELVAVAEPINTTPAPAPAPAAPAAAPAPRTSARGRRRGWTGVHSTHGKRAAEAAGSGWDDIIRATCDACGINCAQLAVAIGCHQTAVSKWKTLRWNPNEKHADALLRLYHASGAARLVQAAKEVTKNATS